MAPPAQFGFIDGGERANNNVGYYAAEGVSANSFSALNGKSYFRTGDQYAPGSSVAPPGFSAVTSYWTIRFVLDSLGDGTTIHFGNAAGNDQVKLVFNGNGSVSLYSGISLLGTSAAAIFYPGKEYQFSLAVKIDATAGFVTIYRDGNPTPFAGVSVSNVDTAADTSSLAITHMSFSTSGVGASFMFRDVSWHDGTGPAPFNAVLGDCGAEYTPASVNVSSQLTPSTGTSNAAIYGAAPPTGAYCGSSTVGAADTVTMAPLPSNVVSVIGFKAFDYAAKSDTGSRAVQKSLKSGSTVVTGAENYLTQSPTLYEDVYTTDPATGAQITVAAYNALQLTETVAA